MSVRVVTEPGMKLNAMGVGKCSSPLTQAFSVQFCSLKIKGVRTKFDLKLTQLEYQAHKDCWTTGPV